MEYQYTSIDNILYVNDLNKNLHKFIENFHTTAIFNNHLSQFEQLKWPYIKIIIEINIIYKKNRRYTKNLSARSFNQLDKVRPFL